MKNSIIDSMGFLKQDVKDRIDQTIGKQLDLMLELTESASDARLIGSAMAKYVAEKISDKILSFTKK